MRKAQQDHALRIRDVGFLPEEEIHSRSKNSTPYEMGHDDGRYPMKRIMDAAEVASGLDPAATPKLVKALADSDSAVRYWGAMGLLMRASAGVKAGHAALVQALKDASPCVRVVAAEALGRYGEEKDLPQVLDVLTALAPLDKNTVYVALLAMNALDALGPKARPVKDRIAAMPDKEASLPERTRGYVSQLKRRILAGLG